MHRSRAFSLPMQSLPAGGVCQAWTRRGWLLLVIIEYGTHGQVFHPNQHPYLTCAVHFCNEV
jgi:hypothetical protein